MLVTFRNNQIDAKKAIKYTPALLFCSVFFFLGCSASVAEAVIREIKGEKRDEQELIVNVLVLPICR